MLTSNSLVHWPDGTKSAPPSDGYVYIDHKTGTAWQWDGFMEKWVRGYGGTADGSPGDILKAENQYSELSKPKCECGAEKVSSDKHSDWCKLFEKTL